MQDENIAECPFEPLTVQDVIDTLGLTIIKDEQNKAATFLCMLSAYTEGSQFNISFNAPSSTGKSYIPMEVAKIFPAEDVVDIGYCSATAFFHDESVSVKVKDQKALLADLSRKIIIFLDQPHTNLLANLRPLLSHDQKEINIKITDKSGKQGLKTKTVILRGYPSVIFCTAGMSIDEQESTRFLLLSPEATQEKLKGGISTAIRREADNESYLSWLNENPARSLLKERIIAIKHARIDNVNLADSEEIERRFLSTRPHLKPRHQRDIKRLISLIKAHALLNLWWRDLEGTTITANKDDVDEGFRIWDNISSSQELNIPPYLYKLYHEVIVPAWQEKQSVLNRQDVMQKHTEVHGRPIDPTQLRQQFLPMLETAGLIIQEDDPKDKRRKLIRPMVLPTIQNNSEQGGGVNNARNDGLKV